MAAVYRAYHPALDRYVAIKVLPDLFSDDEAHRERFRQEARSVARLKHPNIVPIHEIFERWIGKYERHRLQALSDLKKGLEKNKTK